MSAYLRGLEEKNSAMVLSAENIFCFASGDFSKKEGLPYRSPSISKKKLTESPI